jgi:exopolyphosphatase/guanosine-5'-triphosphate,3'-diphosphate pyrophosphatase
MTAIDLGSNSLRVLWYDCQKKQRIYEYQKAVRTAEGLHKSLKIGDQAILRVVAALLEAKKIRGFDDRVVAVTTEAMRKAINAKEALLYIKEQAGVEFRIIDGFEEASLTLSAVRNMLQTKRVMSDNFVVFDLGGGSSELTFVLGDKFVSQSFPIGIVNMVEKYEGDMQKLQANLRTDLSGMKKFALRQKKAQVFVATAGTPTTIASFVQGCDYDHYDYQKINGFVLDQRQIKEALEKLLQMDMAQKERWVGTNRSDLIITGVYIFLEVLSICGFEQVITCDDSLAMGIALEACNEL